jgi:hypothetical protein
VKDTLALSVAGERRRPLKRVSWRHMSYIGVLGFLLLGCASPAYADTGSGASLPRTDAAGAIPAAAVDTNVTSTNVTSPGTCSLMVSNGSTCWAIGSATRLPNRVGPYHYCPVGPWYDYPLTASCSTSVSVSASLSGTVTLPTDLLKKFGLGFSFSFSVEQSFGSSGSGTPNKGYQGKIGYRVTYRQTRVQEIQERCTAVEPPTGHGPSQCTRLRQTGTVRYTVVDAPISGSQEATLLERKCGPHQCRGPVRVSRATL